MERGRRVEPEVEGLAFGEGEAGDVLILRGAQHADEVDGVDDGANVGGVEATAGGTGVGGGVDEVRGGAGGEGFGDALAVAVVEEDGSAGLGEADDLLLDGLLEAVGVGLEGEGGGEFGGALLDGLGVVLRDGLHGGEVALDALLLEGGLVEVGVGADEEAGAAFDGGAKGFEVAAHLRGDEEEGLLGAFGDGDGGAFDGLLVPGIDFGEPVIGRLVGGAAEEGDDEEQVVGLGGGEVGLDPELVAGLEAGDLRDGEGGGAAGDADVDLGADEVEARCVGSMEGWGEKCREDERCDRLNFHVGGFRRGPARVGCGPDADGGKRLILKGGTRDQEAKRAWRRNSRLPSMPRMGESMRARAWPLRARTASSTRWTASWWAAGSRTMPPLPTCSRPASNWGLTRRTASPCQRVSPAGRGRR